MCCSMLSFHEKTARALNRRGLIFLSNECNTTMYLTLHYSLPSDDVMRQGAVPKGRSQAAAR